MAINPAGVSQIGSAMGNHSTGSAKKLTKAVEPIRAGEGYATPSGANINARPNVMARGTQATARTCCRNSLRPQGETYFPTSEGTARLSGRESELPQQRSKDDEYHK